MITERLAKLDETKRISAAVLALLVTACFCYFTVTRHSVVKLREAKAKYTRTQAAHTGIETQQLPLLAQSLGKQLENRKRQLEEQEQKFFSSKQVLEFFESINTLALAHKLKPISRIISEPKRLVVAEKAEPGQQLLDTQSAKIAVSGSYFDIVNFVNELTDRPQKIFITNLHIAMPPGEKSNPRASFSISVLIQRLSTPSHKTDVPTTDAAGPTVTSGPEVDGQISASRVTRLRDPMQFGSANTTQAEHSKLIVKGIVYSEDNPSAVVANKIVHEGDEVLGVTIVKINKDSVEFEMNDKRWTQKVQR